jgi:CheY-like chemotaxis protein
VFLRQLEIARQLGAATALREMSEDLLKDLIRTERRSIDLEEQLAASNRPRHPRPRTESGVDAAVLIVEPEREVADALADALEERGLTTYAYVTGEDAVHDIEQLVADGHAPDLAVVSAELPGIDGFEALVRLRLHLPGLAAFLVTSVRDEEVAARAADLGVVGFAHKPLQSFPEVADRLARLAREGLQRTREHLYLARIKERHEHVLARYRSLPRPA